MHTLLQPCKYHGLCSFTCATAISTLFSSSKGSFLPQSLPELAPLLQLCQLHVLNLMIHNHKLFPSCRQLRDTQNRGIGQFMCIRIPRLEETGKSSCIGFVDKTISLLHGIDAVPLDLQVSYHLPGELRHPHKWHHSHVSPGKSYILPNNPCLAQQLQSNTPDKQGPRLGRPVPLERMKCCKHQSSRCRLLWDNKCLRRRRSALWITREQTQSTTDESSPWTR